MGKEIQNKVEIKNRKARYNFELIDEYTAGIQLQGTEIKSIRMGKVTMSDAHCAFDPKGELFALNMHISPYENASFKDHEEKRARKLLLKKSELAKIKKQVEIKGLTIVPTRLFINEKGLAKLNIATAKGKKLFDKREDIKKKDTDRDAKRNLPV